MPQVLCEKDVSQNLQETMFWNLFFNKVANLEDFKTFKNTFDTKHIRATDTEYFY